MASSKTVICRSAVGRQGHTTFTIYLVLLLLVCIVSIPRIEAWQTSINPFGKRPSFSKRDYRLDADEELLEKSVARASTWQSYFPGLLVHLKDALASTSRSDFAQISVESNEAHAQPERRRISTSKSRTPSESPVVVATANELRAQVLDGHKELGDLTVQVPSQNCTHDTLFDHQVVELILQRSRLGSKPGHRASNDTAVLALAMEGGGMRGAVSAGMAAALTCLGLTDAFDKIYGSSAGSVIGAYLVSRQMCMDVYVDILPDAKNKFVCLKRLLMSICMTVLDVLSSSVLEGMARQRHHHQLFSKRGEPGMNISFVLDGIMHAESGLRPLDLDAFLDNDKDQPLRIASSYAENGRLVPHCFGSEDYLSARGPTNRYGIYACLQASMTVPGAAGPPVRITDRHNHTRSFFDAFCCEPLPYRSAVAEGATHCLVLCSRPDGFQPKTQPSLYESLVAPMYFHAHGEHELARFFERGGQQYLYAEDLLTLAEGWEDRNDGQGVCVPPASILYAVDRDKTSDHLASHRDSWPKAHLLPIKVPIETDELPTLEQGREPVIEAVRSGFAVIYDTFAPTLDLEIEAALTGKDVAKIVFPDPVPVASTPDDTDAGHATSLQKMVSGFSRMLNAFHDVDHDNKRQLRHAAEENGRKVGIVLEAMPGLQSDFLSFSDWVRRSHNFEFERPGPVYNATS